MIYSKLSRSGGAFRRGLRTRKPSATVLLSGGLDSATCLAFYQAQGFSVSSLFIDYGQAAAARERAASRRLARHFDVAHRELRLVGSVPKFSGEVCARNAMLMLTALMESDLHDGLIAIGIHTGTPYYDCTRAFIVTLQALFDGYTNGRVKAAAPFAEMTKREIWQYAQDVSIPVELTYSCQRGGAKPCGRCESCRDRKKLNAVSDQQNHA
jgi:7-cyano-7-deazaguanine synthase